MEEMVKQSDRAKVLEVVLVEAFNSSQETSKEMEASKPKEEMVLMEAEAVDLVEDS